MAGRSATRANLPKAYAFSLVSPPPPKQPTASAPYSAWVRVIEETMRSNASSQDAGRSSLLRSPGTERTSGVSSRCGWSSRLAAVQPLEQRPPRLVGNSAWGWRVAGRAPATIEMPHCREQYGQWVRVGVALTSVSSAAAVTAFRGTRYETFPDRSHRSV